MPYIWYTSSGFVVIQWRTCIRRRLARGDGSSGVMESSRFHCNVYKKPKTMLADCVFETILAKVKQVIYDIFTLWQSMLFSVWILLNGTKFTHRWNECFYIKQGVCHVLIYRATLFINICIVFNKPHILHEHVDKP